MPRLVHAFVLTGFFLLPATVLAQRGGPAPVVIETVVEREFTVTQEFVANLNANRRSIIGSAIDGRVSEFLVVAGQAVKKDQPLAKLRTRTIEIEIVGAEAELALRRAELDERVNGLRPEEIELQRARVEAAQATRDYAAAKSKRIQRVFESAAGVSREEYEAARAGALAADALLKESTSSLSLATKGTRAEQVAQAAAQLDVQAQVVEGLRDRLLKYTIRAPFDGFVVAEQTEAGAWVRQGDPVAEIVEVDPIEVRVFLPEEHIRFIQRGAKVDVRIDSVDEKTFAGKVVQIIPLADPRSRTFPVMVSLDNPMVDGQHRLLPGMLARVALPTGIAKTRMMVPKDSLQFGGPSPVVMRILDGVADIVPVQVGQSEGGWIAVTSAAEPPLQPGDSVVTRGNERLRPGQAVSVQTTTPNSVD